ncbi:MAG: proline--tRNA ligase [Christensenellaceae bacterium]|nr:proline--tRNA ligase [Christensenellaceae bacterium]MDD6938878.1 proline--tRNA ligase [Christensenellaceae bacterium]MDY2747409.1 proline--tRNA ligase [Eubacteriales bacterium]
MKVSELLGERYKDRVAEIESQNLMVRGGYIKQVGNGIYSLMPPARRIHNKIEAILRQEMDRIDGQEVLFPVTMPATLWQASGRWESVGKELLRFKDRSGADMVLGMTHEEAAVHMAMNVASTYQKYPFMIYQIQTKFRDEPRARGGLIRVREFTMKDGYSFHTSQKDLERYYKRCYRAYERIYARVGIPEVVAVASDSGMMGGKVSHEFMLLTDIGEDTIVLCPECGYRANMEAADCIVHNDPDEAMAPLEKVATYDNKTIEDVCSFLHGSAEKSAKAVVYQRNEDDSYVLVFVRGDLEVNETKLRNYLKAEVHPAVEIDHAGLVAGAIGPVNPAKGITVVYDRSLEGTRNLICGANEEGYHFTGLNMDRDVPNAEYADVAKATVGGVCPKCGKHSLTIKNGIEVGNIFQLGRRYTESMCMTYDDEKGNRVNPIMGCYGIGVGRLMASVCEEHHDQYGPVWPISIAPWEIEICALRADQAHVKEEANKLYKSLMDEGYEVLFDDRTVSAGFMFSDADLLGSPVRIVISPKTLDRGVVEIVTRDKTIKEDVPLECAMQRTKEIVAELYARINSRVPESI